MSNVASIKPETIEEEAIREIQEEKSKKAKEALKRKLRELDSAQSVVKNIEREISDLKASITDGSFTG